MNTEEIAQKLCENAYLKLLEEFEKQINTSFSIEEYWERNKDYFIRQAEVYSEVNECLEEK